MNHFYLTVLFSLFFSLLNGQVLQRDSLHTFGYDNGDWELVRSTVYEYLSSDQTIEYYYEVDPSGERIPLRKRSRTYSDNGDLVEELTFFYDSEEEDYIYYEKEVVTYDEDFNRTAYYYYEIDPITNEERNWFGKEFEVFDEFGNYQFSRNLNGTQDNEWEVSNEEVTNLFYNSEDRLDSLSRIGNSATSASAYDYNDENFLIELRGYNDAILSSQYFYHFNEMDQLDTLYYNRNNEDGEAPIPYLRLSYNYDENDRLSCTFQEVHDIEYNLTTKFQYFFSELTDIHSLEEEGVTMQWSNSQFNTLEIKVGDLAANENYQLSIFDASGRIIKNLGIHGSSQWEGKYSLSSGMYYVVLRSEAGAIHTEKVIVH